MKTKLQENGRRDPEMALEYWRKMKNGVAHVSPAPFNKLARALFASQASSPTEERIFSDLSRLDGYWRQSVLSNTMEMMNIIRAFVL